MQVLKSGDWLRQSSKIKFESMSWKAKRVTHDFVSVNLKTVDFDKNEVAKEFQGLIKVINYRC